MAIIRGSKKKETLRGTATDDTITGLAGDDKLFGRSGNDKLNGGSGNDRLSGGGGRDKLTGGTGNDVLDGGTGNDTMKGGSGDDEYVVDAAGDVVIEAAAGGTDLVRSSITFVLGAEVESLTLTGTADIDGTGNDLANTITGNGGANALSGGVGDDTLDGGGGDDTLNGGEGADDFFGGDGLDTVVYTTQIEVTMDNPGAGTGDAFGDTFDSIERVVGSASDDVIQGDANANTLEGGGGSDELKGEGGADELTGGDGDDILHGGAGADTLDGGTHAVAGDTASYAFATARVVATLASGVGDTDMLPSRPVEGEAVGDTYAGIENLTGSSFGDDLYGDAAANVIEGGGGDDIIAGRSGADTLSGGSGTDWFLFFHAGQAGDAIMDFTVGTDKILIVSDASLFYFQPGFRNGLEDIDGNWPNPVALDATYFVADANPVSGGAAHGYFLYDTDAFTLLWDADGTGDGAAFLVATFANNAVLSHTDILLGSLA